MNNQTSVPPLLQSHNRATFKYDARPLLDIRAALHRLGSPEMVGSGDGESTFGDPERKVWGLHHPQRSVVVANQDPEEISPSILGALCPAKANFYWPFLWRAKLSLLGKEHHATTH